MGWQHGNKDPILLYVFVYSEDTIRDKYPYFVVVHHIKEEERYVTCFSKPPTKALEHSIDLGKDLAKTYSIDSSRMYIAGVSTGGDL